MTIEHPAVVREISLDWLNSVLGQNGFLGDARIRAFVNEPFDPGAGQLSAITRVRLLYDRDTDLPSSLVLKFHAPTEGAHEVGMRYRAYEREHRFFTEVAGSMSLPAPVCHASVVDEDNERFILVLEDLERMDFVDQIEGASYEQAVRVVKALARLHASTWGRDEIAKMAWIPEINGEVNQTIPVDFQKNWASYWDKYGPTNPDGARQVGEALSRDFSALLDRKAEIAKELGIVCMCHGDSRLDNVAFEAGGGEGVYLFDWQLSFKNIGPTDVSYFLGGSLTVEMRRSREEELVRLYYDELCALGVDNLSFGTCWDLYRLGHLYYLCYMVTGGTETDVANERSFKLFQVASHRQFTGALDHSSLQVADPSYRFTH